MRLSEVQSLPQIARAKRLERLAAAFAVYRRVNQPVRRIPVGLRRQVVAALEAGVSASAIEKACRVSWSQAKRWRTEAHAGDIVAPAPQVLSVVDNRAPVSSSADGGVELHVGSWRISLTRVVE
jgi:hypothetical protein